MASSSASSVRVMWRRVAAIGAMMRLLIV